MPDTAGDTPPVEPPYECPVGDADIKAAWHRATDDYITYWQNHTHAFEQCREDRKCPFCDKCTDIEKAPVHATN